MWIELLAQLALLYEHQSIRYIDLINFILYSYLYYDTFNRSVKEFINEV
jgi:hypothetical protein